MNRRSAERQRLVIAGLAVLIGVFRLSPGVGIALVILATPAIIQASRSDSDSPWAKLGVFAGTLGMTVAVIVAALAAFCAVCAGLLTGLSFH